MSKVTIGYTTDKFGEIAYFFEGRVYPSTDQEANLEQALVNIIQKGAIGLQIDVEGLAAVGVDLDKVLYTEVEALEGIPEKPSKEVGYAKDAWGDIAYFYDGKVYPTTLKEHDPELAEMMINTKFMTMIGLNFGEGELLQVGIKEEDIIYVDV